MLKVLQLILIIQIRLTDKTKANTALKKPKANITSYSGSEITVLCIVELS
jgi:hypothetical protein